MSEVKIDLEVLEKLWDGKLYIAEQCYPQDKEYKVMVNELDAIHTQLLGMVDENSQAGKLLERYEQQTSMVADREQLEAFKKGFAIAVSMAAETLSKA